MITVTLTLQITDLQARKICGPVPAARGADHQLASSVASLARDAIAAALAAQGDCSPTIQVVTQNETIHLLHRLEVINKTLPTLDPESPEIPALMDHADAINLKLTGTHDPEVHQAQLPVLRSLYAEQLAEGREAEDLA